MNALSLIAFVLVVSVCAICSGQTSIEARNGDSQSESVPEAIAEQVLTLYMTGDMEGIRQRFPAGERPPVESLRQSHDALRGTLGETRGLILSGVEQLSDGCTKRLYALQLEHAAADLEMTLCRVDDGWSLQTFLVVPHLIGLAEYMIVGPFAAQVGGEIIAVDCGVEPPPIGGHLNCIAISGAGETAAITLLREGRAALQVVGAEITSPWPAEASRQTLEPVALEFLRLFEHGDSNAIYESAAPFFRRAMEPAALERVVQDVHEAFGSGGRPRWSGLEYDNDGLPIARLSITYEDAEGEAFVKVIPFDGRWALMAFLIKAPESSRPMKVLHRGFRQRTVKAMTFDQQATLDCPSDDIQPPGSTISCNATTGARQFAVELHRASEPLFLVSEQFSVSCQDFLVALGQLLRDMSLPLRRAILNLRCEDPSPRPGTITTCTARFDDAERRLLVRRDETTLRIIDVRVMAGDG